jgi:dihydroxy-acid dehydratase
VGGPIALVQDGDAIIFDLLAGSIHWEVSPEEIARRRQGHQVQRPRHFRTYLADFAATTAQAHEGCISLRQ